MSIISRPWCIDRAIATEVNKLFINWPFHYGPGQRYLNELYTWARVTVRWHWSVDIRFDNCQWTITWVSTRVFYLNHEIGPRILRTIMHLFYCLFCWPLTILYYLKVKNDHRSKFSNLSNWKEEAWKKNQGFNGIRTHDLRVADALLYQLSYEATHWERGQFIEFVSPVRNEMMWSIWNNSYLYYLLVCFRVQVKSVSQIKHRLYMPWTPS